MNRTTTPPASNISLENPSMLQENLHNFLKRKDLLYTLRYDRIIIYKGLYSELNGRKRSSVSDENLKKRKYTGNLNKEASKFISKQLTLWHQSISNYNTKNNLKLRDQKRNFVFLTVTLPATQIHRDNEIKRVILVPFLNSLKYHFNIKGYFWRAEAQANNNIHFHIIIDTFCAKEKVTRLWNQACEKLGYVTEFAKKHGHFNPPTCKLNLIKNVNKHVKYVLKYTTKNSDSRAISGKIWGMSDNIRNLCQFTELYDSSITDFVQGIFLTNKQNMTINEHFVSINLNKSILKEKIPWTLKINYELHLSRIYTYIYEAADKINTDQYDTLFSCLDHNEQMKISREIKKIPDISHLPLFDQACAPDIKAPPF